MAITVAQLQAVLTANTTAFDRSMTRSEKRFQAVGRSVGKAGSSMTRSFTVPILAIAAVSIKMANDFETSMTKVVALVGVARKQVNQWGEDILEMAPELGKAPEELADALYFVTSAGFRGAQAMDILKISAMASATGLGETKVVADALTSAINAYGIETLSAREGTNTMIAAVTQGKLPVEDLAGSIGQVLGVASEVGVSFQEVAGTAAALSRVGAPVKRTMTGIRFLLTGLINPSSAAAKVLKHVGLSVGDIAKSLREKGLLATLTELKKRLPIRDFLKVVGGARGVVTALGLVGKNAKQAEKVMSKVGETGKKMVRSLHGADEGFGRTTGKTDELGKAWEEIQKDQAFKLQKALATLQSAAITLGATLAPVFSKIATAVAGVGKWFNSLSDSGQHWVKVGLVILATVGPMLIIFGKMFVLVARLSAIMRILGVTSLFAQASILLIPLAIAAFIAVLIVAYKKSETFKRIVDATWHGIKKVVGAVVSFIRQHWKAMLIALTLGLGLVVALIFTQWKRIKSVIGAVIGFIRDHWKLMLSIMTGGIGTFVIWVVSHWSTIKDKAVAAFNKVKDVVKDVFDKVKGFIQPVVDKITDLIGLVKSFWQAIRTGLSKVTTPFSKFADLVGKVGGFFKSAGGAVSGFFSGDGVVGAGLGAFSGASNASISPTLFDDLGLGQSMGLTLSSGYRPGAVTSTGNPSLHGVFPAKAIDMTGSEAAMRRYFLMEVARGALTGLREVIHSPYWWHPGSGITTIPSSAGSVLADHYSHVHVGSYDHGGFLRPGWNYAYNGTGRNEPVGFGGNTYNFNIGGSVISERDLHNLIRRLQGEHWQRGGA